MAGVTLVAAAMIGGHGPGAPHGGSWPAAMLLSGAAWLVVVSRFNVAVQTAVPAWVRARVLAVYMLVFAGGFSAGSAVWGTVATHQSLPAALLCSALALGLQTPGRHPLPGEPGR